MASEIADLQSQLEETETTIKDLQDQLTNMKQRKEDLMLLLAEKRLHAQVDNGGIVAALRHWDQFHDRNEADLRKPMRVWLQTLDPHLIWSTRNGNDRHARSRDFMILYWARRRSTPQDVAGTAETLTVLGRELREAKASDPDLRGITVSVIHEDEPHQFTYDESASVRLRLTAAGWDLVTPKPPVVSIASSGDDCLPLLEQARIVTLAAEK
ncbi:hypothetical protein [Streptomyces chartreusis]|uniref:Uncharacterized protein n=1 Tax=Streptomyces chartreusis TaxID=1969 RepID=A0A7H8TBG5_STRCX|nr:hypothetical protein [Streptomyces chartreusis]QKZ20302.1 hypothetical protein HUT05_24890 [Streptomyces chartreusis]